MKVIYHLLFALFLCNVVIAGAAEELWTMLKSLAASNHKLKVEELQKITDLAGDTIREISRTKTNTVKELQSESFYTRVLSLDAGNTPDDRNALSKARITLAELLNVSGRAIPQSPERVSQSRDCMMGLFQQFTVEIRQLHLSGFDEHNAAIWSGGGVDKNGRQIGPPQKEVQANVLARLINCQERIFVWIWFDFYSRELLPTLKEKKTYFMASGLTENELERLISTLPEFLRNE